MGDGVRVRPAGTRPLTRGFAHTLAALLGAALLHGGVLGVLCAITAQPVRAQPGPDASVDLSRPLGLNRLIEIAAQQNLGLLQAEELVESQKGNLRQSRSALFPSLNASAGFNRTFNQFGEERFDPDLNIFVGGSSANSNYRLGLNGGVNLLDVPVWYSYLGAGQSLDAQRAAFRRTESNLVKAVKDAYFALVRAQQLAQVNREDVTLREEQLARSQALYELGSVARSDVLQAQVNLATSRRELISAENSIEKQRASLNLILGVPVNSPTEVEEPRSPRDLVPAQNEEQLVQAAYEQRADLQQSKLAAASARSSETASKWQRWPSLGMNYSYSANDRELDQLVNNSLDEFTVTFSLGLSWTLFDGFATKGSIQRAIAARRSQEYATEEQQLQVALDVHTAVLDIQSAEEQIRSAEEGVAFAEESVKLQKALYESGGGTLLEWNNAQVELTRARVSLVQAEIDLHLALALLANATGAP